MKTKKSTSAKKENTVRLRSYSTMFALLGIAAMILFAAFLLMDDTKTLQNSPTVANLPALQGESAITHLKENKIYDSLAEAVTAARYQVDSTDTGATAKNDAHDLQMNFTDGGLQLKSTAKDKNWISKWRLSSFGYGTNQRAAADGSWQTVENRVELRRDDQQITEWFVNQPNGVEHGFTLAARPDSANNGEALRLVIKLDGDLTAQADENGQALTLLETDGAKALRYEKLKVWDADGKDLTARMQTERGGEVWLEVEDAAAVYPITIDPTFMQQARLTASDGAYNDQFGRSVSISGDTAIVGAYIDDVGGNINQGSAYIFVRNGNVWTQQQKLTASDGAEGNQFGTSVSISGDTVIVGEPANDLGPANQSQGSAFIFVRNGTVWTQQQKLNASDGAEYDDFGWSVSISGDTVIVGAVYNDTEGNNDQGSAYIFQRSGTTWTEQQKITASDGAANDFFGHSVSISGDTAIAGAYGDDSRKGSAYIFQRSGVTWAQQQKITASDGATANFFGYSVSISGDTVIVGEPGNDLGPEYINQGSAFIFFRSGTVWTQQQKLNPSDGTAGNNFGNSVSISGNTVIIGTQTHKAYIFDRSGIVWTQQQILTASDSVQGFFGFSVSISDNTAIVGAWGDNKGQEGAAYIFQDNTVPTLGNYPDTTVVVGSNTTITPDAAPTNTTSINVSTDTNFKGLLAANLTTGVVRITNAHPAGTYTVTVKAFNAGGMTTRTFTLTVVSGTACNGTVQFTDTPDIIVNNNRLSLAIGDFNNDGNQDYAITSSFTLPFPITNGPGSGARVLIRLGNGTGGFSNAPDVTSSVGAPRSIAIGDFNNDGNQDFATANVDSTVVSIRLGDGAGNFSNASDVSLNLNPRGIAIGDFNNDGNQDFATTGGNTLVAIRLGDGTGNFGGTTNIDVGGNGLITNVAIGDFNNDGNQDFATNAVFGNSVAIRLGDGTGNFGGTTQVIVGSNADKVAIGDFNRDGNQDFAIADQNADKVSIRLGDGTGNFSGGTNVSVGDGPFSVAIGDFNNDGNQDIAVNAYYGRVSILLGNGTGSFTNTGEVITSGGPAPSNIVVGDLNNDGNQDFATTSYFTQWFQPPAKVSTRLGSCLVTPTPTPTPVVSGRVTYANASTTIGVPFTTLNAAGLLPLSTLTDVNGFYSLNGFGAGAYTITPIKTSQVNGISNLDSSTVAQHVAGLITLNANQQIAADASGNGAISSLDAAYISQFVAAVPNPGITGTWKFLPANRSYADILINQLNQDYSAILVGDVTGNWSPAGPLRPELAVAESEQKTQAKKGGQLVTAVAQTNKSAGEDTALTIDLTAADTTGEGILGYQFDLLYDKQVIEPQAASCDVSETISRGMTAICHAVEPGVLKVVVFGTKPISGGGTLLRMNFKMVGARGATLPLTIENFMFNEDLPTAVTINERW